ncbi:MAG: hypothetical protein ABJA76_09910 [Mucilaginibacter sp.]
MMQVFIYAIIAIGFVIWLVIASKNKSKWGMNLKRVSCPVCQTKQPIVRMPKSGSQALWGGTICPNCSANLDKYGNIIP